jgi:hypothetical protein
MRLSGNDSVDVGIKLVIVLRVQKTALPIGKGNAPDIVIRVITVNKQTAGCRIDNGDVPLGIQKDVFDDTVGDCQRLEHILCVDHIYCGGDIFWGVGGGEKIGDAGFPIQIGDQVIHINEHILNGVRAVLHNGHVYFKRLFVGCGVAADVNADHHGNGYDKDRQKPDYEFPKKPDGPFCTDIIHYYSPRKDHFIMNV